MSHFLVLNSFAYSEHWDPKTCPADDLIGEISLYIDELMNIEDVERLGIVLILDLSGYGLKHAKIATPSQMHKLVSIFHVRYSFAYKQINQNYSNFI